MAEQMVSKVRLTNPTYLSRRAIERSVIEFLRLFEKEATVLDLGCGDCPYREYARCSYIGIDTDRQSQADVVYDGRRVPLSDGVADGIVCTQTLQHVVDVPAIMAEMHRLLKPGGRVLISVPFLVKMVGLPRSGLSPAERSFPVDIWRDDFWRFTPYGLALLSEQFEVVEVCPTTGYGGVMSELFLSGLASVSRAWPVRFVFVVGNCLGGGADGLMNFLGKRWQDRRFQKFYTHVYQSATANYILVLRKRLS